MTAGFQRVYYADNGKIIGRDNNAQSTMPFKSKIFSINEPINANDMIDPVTRNKRSMSACERYIFNLPNDIRIRSIRDEELLASDWREMRGQDEWIKYRQILRDITKIGDALAIVEAWPARPDGSDALEQYRLSKG